MSGSAPHGHPQRGRSCHWLPHLFVGAGAERSAHGTRGSKAPAGKRQEEGIRKAAARGLVVKINCVVVPGVNAHHVADIARAAARRGARLMNCIALVPVQNTPPGNRPKPDCRLLARVRDEAPPCFPRCVTAARAGPTPWTWRASRECSWTCGQRACRTRTLPWTFPKHWPEKPGAALPENGAGGAGHHDPVLDTRLPCLAGSGRRYRRERFRNQGPKGAPGRTAEGGRRGRPRFLPLTTRHPGTTSTNLAARRT